MTEQTLKPLGIEPWFAEPETERSGVISNMVLWLVAPLVLSLFLWVGLRLMHFPLDPDYPAVVSWVAKIFAFVMGVCAVLPFLATPYALLYIYQLSRLSARLRGFALGGHPEGFRLYLFHAGFWALLAAAMTLIGVYVLDLGRAAAVVAANWRDPCALFHRAAFSITEGSWLRLFAVSYFYTLAWWLCAEIIFFFRSESSRVKVIRVEGFEPDGQAARIATVVHLTDLHVTADDEGQLREGGAGGNKGLHRVLNELRARPPDELNAVLITGDITDAGTADEWRRFFELFPADLLAKSVLVPGNHELNIPVGRGRAAAIDPADKIERKIRAIRFVAAVDMAQGARSYVVNESNPETPLRPLRTYLAPHGAALELFIKLSGVSEWKRKNSAKQWAEFGVDLAALKTSPERAWRNLSALPYRVLDDMFPLVVEVPGTELHFVVLNSNDEALDILTNAYGLIGREQLRRLRFLLKRLSGLPYVIALHHHLGVVSFGKTLRERVCERAMAVIDGGALVKALSEAHDAGGCVVFNGHRHVGYFAQIGDRIQIVSGPSSTLGDESGRRPAGELGFGVYEIGWHAGTGTKCLSERWRTLA